MGGTQGPRARPGHPRQCHGARTAPSTCRGPLRRGPPSAAAQSVCAGAACMSQLGPRTSSRRPHCTPPPPAPFLPRSACSCTLPVGKPFSSPPPKPPLKPAGCAVDKSARSWRAFRPFPWRRSPFPPWEAAPRPVKERGLRSQTVQTWDPAPALSTCCGAKDVSSVPVSLSIQWGQACWGDRCAERM